jgi:hypothetical protein
MIADAEGLDLREYGALTILRDLMFANGGSFPDDGHRISRSLRCDPRGWPKLRERLLSLGKLYLDGDKLRSPYVDKSLKASDQYRSAQAMRAQIGAAKRAMVQQGRSTDAASHQHGCAEKSQKPLKTLDSDSALAQPYQRPEARYKEEEGKAAPPSAGNAVGAAQEGTKGSGEQSEQVQILISDTLARQIQSRSKWHQ